MKTAHALEMLESRRLLASAAAIVVGNVFHDTNGDGVRQSTEAGQSGAKVYLDYNSNGQRDGDAEPIATTTSTGSYKFENAQTGKSVQVRLLLAGTKLIQTLPANNAPRLVTPVAGQTKEVERFGVTEPATPPPTTAKAILTGTVYRDANGNGLIESTEKGQPNVKVYVDYNGNSLRDGDAEPLATTTSNGTYRITNVTPGSHLQVRLLLAGTNFVQTRPANNDARYITIANGQTLTVESFGVNERPAPPPVVTTAILTGNVFRDANGNGAIDTGEHGQANVKVFVDYNNNGVRDGDAEPLAITNGDGAYRFEKVTPGTQLAVRLLLTDTNLVQTLPANSQPRIVAASAGQTVAVEAFGVNETPTPPPPPPTTAGLNGKVFRDRNRNGQQESTEVGQPNINVYLDYNGNGQRDGDAEQLVTTNSSGVYHFDNVVPTAHLQIRLLLDPNSFVQTRPANNDARYITINAGQTLYVESFGVDEVTVTPPPPPAATTLSGIVYTDRDRSGSRSDGETGRPNAKVYLDLNNNGAHDDGEQLVTTTSTGAYQFTNVAAGDKTVRLFLDGTNLQQTDPSDGPIVVTVVSGQENAASKAFGVAEIQQT